MNENALSGGTDSVPLNLNFNAIETTQSSEGRQELANLNCTPLLTSNLRTPMRVQVEYPDNISRKRRHSRTSLDGRSLLNKASSDRSNEIIEQFREECLEDDVLLSQVADFHVNNEPIAENHDNLTLGVSDSGRVFARCYTLSAEKSPKKAKLIVYDSDGLGGDSD